MEFAVQSNEKLIIDGLSNLAMKANETTRELLTRVTQTMVVIKESYNTYQNKVELPNEDLNGGVSTNFNTAYVNDHTANIMNVFKMNMLLAALPSEIRHAVVQQNQNELTLDWMYDVATMQQREITETKRIMAIGTNYEPEHEESKNVAFQRRQNWQNNRPKQTTPRRLEKQ